MLFSAFPVTFILQNLLVPSLFSSYTVAQQHPLHVASSLLFEVLSLLVFLTLAIFLLNMRSSFLVFFCWFLCFCSIFKTLRYTKPGFQDPFSSYFMFFLYILLNSSNSSSKTYQSFFISLFPSSLHSAHQQVPATIMLKHFLTSASFYLRSIAGQ